MSQGLGRFSKQSLGFINYSNIDVFAVQTRMNTSNYLIFSSGATKKNCGAIKMLSVPLGFAACYQRDARTKTFSGATKMFSGATKLSLTRVSRARDDSIEQAFAWTGS